MRGIYTLREWLQRLWGTLSRRRSDADLEEELRAHVELAAEDVRRDGTPIDPNRSARIKAGRSLQAMEALRDQRGLPVLEDLARDIRYGLRTLRRSPVFTSVCVLTLALGIGANAAIFSIVDGVLLRPLSYPRSSQLMFLSTRFPALGFPQFWVSVPEYLEFQQFNHSFAQVGAFRTSESNLLAGETAFSVRSAIVDAHLLNALGVRAVRGRLFRREDEIVTAPPLPEGSAVAQPVVLISYELWQSAFGGRPIVGERVEVDGRWLEIIGVMARGTDLMDKHVDIWLPLGFTADERLARNNHNLYLIGRLREGETAASAQTELNALAETWGARTGVAPGLGHAGHIFLPLGKGDGHMLQITPLRDQILGRAGRSIWMLQAVVGLVLLIACANVTNLLLARAETRRREFAMLAALGAGRSRLFRTAVTESVILCITGGALGVMLARLGIDALVRAYPTSLPRINEVAVGQRVIVVSLGIALVLGVLFGFLSLTRSRLDSIANSLKSASPGSSDTSRHRLRRALVVAETALAVIVVVGAGLLLRTVQNLTAVDPGFDRSRLVTFSIALPPASYDFVGRVRAYQVLLQQLRKLPGVHAASAMTSLPLDREYISNQTEITNSTAPSEPLPTIDYQRVMSGFFDTMGIPILKGRGFQSTDAALPGYVTVINKTLANTYWKGRNPIGQRLRPAGGGPWFTVIGVVEDVKQTSVDQPVGAEAYVLVDQLATESPTTWLAFSPTTMHVVVRTGLPLETLAPMVARLVRQVDPAVPVARLREMDEVFNESIRRPRLLAQLLTLFSTLALLLATIGTYGVLAYMVAERRREMGIRLALGARRGSLLWRVMIRGFTPAGIGVVFGLAASFGLSRFLSSLLFGVEPVDATTLAIAIPTVIGVAAFACWLPAWRASRVDPNMVLRVE